jgi:hypothetical protein
LPLMYACESPSPLNLVELLPCDVGLVVVNTAALSTVPKSFGADVYI